MVLFQMGLELFAAVNNYGTLPDLTGQAFFSTSPCFYLVMLSVLMSFPIVFATKRLVTCSVCTAIGSTMSLLVFPIYFLVSVKVLSYFNLKKGLSRNTLQIATPNHSLWTLVTSDPLPLLGVSGFGRKGIFGAAFTRRPIATKKTYKIGL